MSPQNRSGSHSGTLELPKTCVGPPNREGSKRGGPWRPQRRMRTRTRLGDPQKTRVGPPRTEVGTQRAAPNPDPGGPPPHTTHTAPPRAARHYAIRWAWPGGGRWPMGGRGGGGHAPVERSARLSRPGRPIEKIPRRRRLRLRSAAYGSGPGPAARGGGGGRACEQPGARPPPPTCRPPSRQARPEPSDVQEETEQPPADQT